MARASGPLLLVAAAVVLLLSIGSCIAHGGAGAEGRRQRYMVVQTSYLEPKSICSGLKGTYICDDMRMGCVTSIGLIMILLFFLQ